MRLLFTILLLAICTFVRGAVPTFESFSDQFQTNNFRVFYRAVHTNDAGVIYPALTNSLSIITNLNTYGTFSLPSKVELLTLGTNYLDVSTNSTWLLNSPTNDAAQVILSLSAGAYQGQLLFITSQNGSNSFTLPDLSEQWDVPGAYVDIQGDWLGTTNRGIILQYTAPDWIEMARFDPSQTGGGTVSGSGTLDYLPKWITPTTLGDSPLSSGNPYTVTLRSTNTQDHAFIFSASNTNSGTAFVRFDFADSSGIGSAAQINGIKNTGWGAGTPTLRDGTLSFQVQHDNALKLRLEISGDSGTVTFKDRDGLNTVATIANVSGYTGAGTLFLSDDGTYKPSTGTGTTINPTNNFIPYRVNSTTFEDSPLQRSGASSVHIAQGGGTVQLGVGSGIPFISGDSLLQISAGTGVLLMNEGSYLTPESGGVGMVLGTGTNYFGGLFLGTNGLHGEYTDDGSQLLRNGVPIGGAGSALWASAGGVLEPSPAIDLVRIESQLADNATNVALIVDTAAPWNLANTNNSTAFIAAFKSAGTNLVTINPLWGQISIGRFANTPGFYNNPGDVIFSHRDADQGDYPRQYAFFQTVASLSGRAASIDLGVSDTFTDIDMLSVDGAVASNLQIWTEPTDTFISLFTGGSTKMNIHPTVTSTGSAVAYLLGTRNVLTNEDRIASFRNVTSDRASIYFDGRLTLQGQTNRFGDNGTAPTFNGNVIGAPVGTMVASGMTTAGVVPMTTGTSGTNFVASPMQGTGTNVAFNGNITANSETLTNTLTFTASNTGLAFPNSARVYETSGFVWLRGGSGNFIAVASSASDVGRLFYGSSLDTSLERDSAARLQLGADAASPVSPQIFGVADGLGTDKNGSDFQHSGGRGTGTGRGGALSGKTSLTTTTGSSVQTESTRYYHSAKFVDLTESTATTFANIALASSKYLGVRLNCTVSAADATDFQAVNSNVSFSAVNKAGTVTVGAVTQNDDATAASAGTLTVTYTAVANGSGVDIKANAVSSLTQTQLRCKWMITSLNSDDTAVVTPQ